MSGQGSIRLVERRCKVILNRKSCRQLICCYSRMVASSS
jgi:hypothetical protein